MASPFESAREPAALGAGERARLDQAAAVSDVTPPAATTEMQPGLDSTTRDSLSRLALLIRTQLKAVEPPDAHTESKPDDDSDEVSKAKPAAGAGEFGPAFVAPDAFPAIVRLGRRFEQAARERGSRIYGQQKSKDAVQLILSEIERRHSHIHLENAEELLIPLTSSTRRAA